MNLLSNLRPLSYSCWNVLVVLFVSVVQYQRVESKLNFCFKGHYKLGGEVGLQDTPSSPSGSLNCPGGVLFRRPYRLDALTSNSETFCVKNSVCDETWQCGTQKQSIIAQLVKVGKPEFNESWNRMEDNDEITHDIPECSPHKLWLTNHESPKTKMRSGRSKRDALNDAINGLVPSERTSKAEIQREVDDQTKRMFYYLLGINDDAVNSHLRVVKLFKMSTQLVSILCDPKFLKPAFLQEIEKGFLFLLKEQGFDRLQDVDVDSYSQLKQAMEYCATNVSMVKFMGEACPGRTKFEYMYRNDRNMKPIPYRRDEKAFKWGEYDIVLDAAWGIINIVHGGCFEAFSSHLNLHHKFQVMLEQLFHAALYLRWEHPTQLGDDAFYDNVFLAQVNTTMEVMDACSQYIYTSTPFETPLNRPIHETISKRRKRSTERKDPMERAFISKENLIESSEFLRHNGLGDELDQNGYYENPKQVQVASCLQSDKELHDKVTKLRKDLRCDYVN